MTQSDAPNEGREEKHLEFLREYAKCGIYHNHTDNDLKDRLKLMDDAISFLRDQLSKEREMRKELVEEIQEIVLWCDDMNYKPDSYYKLKSLVAKASELDKNKTTT